jgi:hypothetical protein
MPDDPSANLEETKKKAKKAQIGIFLSALFMRQCPKRKLGGNFRDRIPAKG